MLAGNNMDTQDLIRRASSLPASKIADDVNTALTPGCTLVITAPPGAGKSTLLPLTIAAGIPDTGRILMLEPRRLAARQIAERMAQMLDEPVGKTVGYRVRFERKVSAQTRIEVLTEGILTRMIVDDPTLDGVSTVIFDEFHERSINSDLALALARQSRNIIRPDLRIVMMSATIDTAGICKALNAKLIQSEGRMFPVKVVHAGKDTDKRDIAQAAAIAIAKAHRDDDGDILVFLPGQGDIERCQEIIGKELSPTSVLPLYGNLSPDRQRKAIAPSRNGERKVVLATPVAETSITIEGVRVVIDSGLCRSLAFDARTGLSHLETVRISMDMARQRTGRAGRVQEGICYRLWTCSTEKQMAKLRRPEIEYADLAPMVLEIAASGEKDVESLPWLTVPPQANVTRARELLVSLGALNEDGGITSIGKKMATLPCHPRIARMILQAGSDQMKSLACDVSALLEEKDPAGDSAGTDLSMRVSALRSARRNGQLGRWLQIARISEEYHRMAHTAEGNADPSPEDIGLLIAYAYPERIAQSIDNIGGYRLAGGGQAHLEHTDRMTSHKWLAIASLNDAPGSAGRVFLAAPLNPDDLGAGMVKELDHVAWDSREGCVVMQHERRAGKLIISSKPIHSADSSLIINIICEAIRKDGLSMLSWSDDEVIRLQKRIAQASSWHPELDIPDISTGHLLETASEWLPPYLEDGAHIRSSTAELKRLDLAAIIWNIIPYNLQVEIDKLAPTHIKVPTGSWIRVDYRQGAEAPVLSVRLQECFGMAQTPRIDNGRRPVLMELLSPGFKPVQLTQDLESFWKGTYFEVRKELRRRYPKHFWPENPLEAEAVRGVKRH